MTNSTATPMTNIIPLHDIYDHHNSKSCMCCPVVIEEFHKLIIVHNSYDAREFEEHYPSDPWIYVYPYTPSRYSH